MRKALNMHKYSLAVLKRLLPLFLAGVIAACSSDPVNTNPHVDDCEAPSLKVQIDGVDYTPTTPVNSSSTVHSLAIYNQTEVAKAYHMFVFTLPNPGAVPSSVTFPDSQISADYQLQPNEDPRDHPIVAVTNRPTGISYWFQAEVKGSVDFKYVGAAVGDPRCGTFDLQLTWTGNDGDHSARVTGSFNTRIKPDDNR